MITFTKGARPAFETISGRIVLVGDGSRLGGFASPFRVLEDAGAKVLCAPLARRWSEEDRRWIVEDGILDDRSHVAKKSIRVACDSVSEAVALMEVGRQAEEEYAQLLKRKSRRMASLAGASIPPAADVVLLSLDHADEWTDPTTGHVLFRRELD